jgi:hypothetical protein
MRMATFLRGVEGLSTTGLSASAGSMPVFHFDRRDLDRLGVDEGDRAGVLSAALICAARVAVVRRRGRLAYLAFRLRIDWSSGHSVIRLVLLGVVGPQQLATVVVSVFSCTTSRLEPGSGSALSAGCSNGPVVAWGDRIPLAVNALSTTVLT